MSEKKEIIKITFFEHGQVQIDTELGMNQVITALEGELLYFKAKRKLKIEEQVKSDREMMNKK